VTTRSANRRPRRRDDFVGMLRRLSFIVGAVVGASGLAMLPAIITALIYQEWDNAGLITLAMGITMATGAFMWRVLGKSGVATTKEGFATVGLAWIFMTFFGTLPFLLTGEISNFTNAFFETAAGFTTTGSSIVPDPSTLSKSILMWRATTQWLGGMGIIVLSVAILPLLGIGGVQLARAEAPGPTPDRLAPRMRETAKRLWLVYVGFTAVEAFLLWLGDMDLFDAIAHSFTTMSTGGFGTRPDSIGGFSPYTQWVIIVFMLAAGTSFALHFRGLRKPVEYARNAEFRWYLGMVVGALIVVGGGLWANETGLGVEETIRTGAFTALTLVTTTGFGTADWTQWVSGLQIFVVGLMFLGGMAGSTAGGVKTFRIAVLSKAASADLRRLVHPRGIFVTRFGDKSIPDSIVESIQSFFLFFMFLFMTGTFLLGFIVSNTGDQLDLVTSASAVASALGNIGPGLGDVGPAGNFATVPGAGKWLLAFLMIVGRLEIFPVLLLFTRTLWKR